MPALKQLGLPRVPVMYPQSVETILTLGTTKQYTMKRTQGVFHYQLLFTEGALTGGTTPLWAVSAAIPIITHVKLEADNEVLFDVDTDLLQEYSHLVATVATATGLDFQIPLADHNFHNFEEFDLTVFPSWVHSQVILSLTYATLATATSGTPTGVPFTLDIIEEDTPRSQVTFKPLRVKRLQTSASQALISDSVNDNPTLIAQTGAYKAILMRNDTNANDTDFTKIQIYVNDVALNKDTSWLMAKRDANTAFAPQVCSARFAMLIWQRGNDLSQLFNVADTRVVTSVNLKVTNHPAAATTLKVMRILYV
jgi:hypothetical protein